MDSRSAAATAVQPPESERSREIRALYPKLLRAAYLRLQRAGDWGAPVDVVQVAILALTRGDCPPAVPIEAFLKQKIRNIVSNAARARKRVPHILVDDPEILDALLEEPPEDDSVDRRTVAGKVIDALISTANEAGDAEVALMVEVYRDGAESRAEVAMALGLSLSQHDAARKRLTTLCRRLPNTLVDAVRTVFGMSL